LNEETEMLRTIILSAAVAAVAALLTPSKAGAYGAAHVGYTHVGPNGVQHYGATAASGPHGTYEGSHTTAAGAGGAYHAGYHTETGSGGSAAAYGGYHYSPSYSGGAAAGGAHYAYVR
jgi:hypothetical protein